MSKIDIIKQEQERGITILSDTFYDFDNFVPFPHFYNKNYTFKEWYMKQKNKKNDDINIGTIGVVESKKIPFWVKLKEQKNKKKR